MNAVVPVENVKHCRTPGQICRLMLQCANFFFAAAVKPSQPVAFKLLCRNFAHGWDADLCILPKELSFAPAAKNWDACPCFYGPDGQSLGRMPVAGALGQAFMRAQSGACRDPDINRRQQDANLPSEEFAWIWEKIVGWPHSMPADAINLCAVANGRISDEEAFGFHDSGCRHCRIFKHFCEHGVCRRMR
ncbi:hypothetical protein [Phyllobacterium phragmitis]|uniref:hypothetical protein n=1 Tax=Phyllobacterium phragmitis TaxID=2670329 RepID=UPI0038B2E2AC